MSRADRRIQDDIMRYQDIYTYDDIRHCNITRMLCYVTLRCATMI